MSDSIQTPVVELTPVVEADKAVPADSSKASKPSPAQELRDIQQLLVVGIYPGNMAPAVVKGYQLLDKMCSTIEAVSAPKADEVKP